MMAMGKHADKFKDFECGTPGVDCGCALPQVECKNKVCVLEGM